MKIESFIIVGLNPTVRLMKNFSQKDSHTKQQLFIKIRNRFILNKLEDNSKQDFMNIHNLLEAQ